MKLYLLIIALFVVSTGSAQPVGQVPAGASNQHVYDRGGHVIDSVLVIPLTDTARARAYIKRVGVTGGAREAGIIAYAGNTLYHYKSGQWWPLGATSSLQQVALPNTTPPAAPASGGVIYVENGTLKYKSNLGNITVIGNQ